MYVPEQKFSKEMSCMDNACIKATWHREMDQNMQKGLAEAYIPFQIYDQIYEPEVGLRRGTIFPELDKPYSGKSLKLSAKFKSIYQMEGEE